MKCLVFALAALGALACSSSSGAPQTSSVTGTFAGQALDVADTAGFQGETGPSTYLAVVLSSVTGVCSVAQQHATTANSDSLALLIQNLGVASAMPLAAGTYTITNGDPAVTGKDSMTGATSGYLVVSASYSSYDASCSPTLATTASGATSGTITIGTLSSSDVSGSFDLRFPSGDHLSGHFSSPLCSAPELAFAPPTNANVGGAASVPAEGAQTVSTCLP
jgi:hypothetical protein